RCGGSGPLLRLRPGGLQAVRLDAVRSHLRRRRRALRAAGGDHQSLGDVAGELGGDRHLGGGRRPRHPARPDPGSGADQRRQELAHGRRARAVAVRPGAPLHRGHALASGRRARPPQAGAEVNLDTPQGPVLYLDGVTVSFDGFKALSGLSLIIEPGELRCIIGPNGAGKTTLMDVVTGKTRPDSGEVYFGEANDLTRMSETEIAEAGIGRKFQKPTVFRNHTVLEN